MKAPRGFVLGKFMPPHNGHLVLCGFGEALVDELTILVCSLPDDPIPGALRVQWMQTLFPHARVQWCNEIIPQTPEDDVNFWPVWRDVVRRYHPEPIDFVFASESYGMRLAFEVGARFAPCDPQRIAARISATAIRANPVAHWDDMPDLVRAYFTKRICVFGPESSGKTTLAEALSAALGAPLAPEYGRIYTETYGLDLNADDLTRIATGQSALSAVAKRLARGVVIEDTDALLTAIWSEMLLGEAPLWLHDLNGFADLYLLCDVDFPWVDDGTRYFADPAQRQRFFTLCETALKQRGLRYHRVTGDHETRLRSALAAIHAL